MRAQHFIDGKNARNDGFLNFFYGLLKEQAHDPLKLNSTLDDYFTPQSKPSFRACIMTTKSKAKLSGIPLIAILL
jgi:hypothetical protein